MFYIGVAGVSTNALSRSSFGARISRHAKSESKRGKWTHYSFFEVHDKLSREELLELEGLFLRIFLPDDRIGLDNSTFGSKTLKRLSKDSAWKPITVKLRAV